ncbi:hypothetical protein IFM89_008388 [Coptis chinensis]|uniref:Neutral ceramidase n=1 Tax=Coptis chinensis TaxID=261450 RepID=A0A835LLU2_9MAGN|nr:hypothetical protein IFM89_008388 [Coptis chinensis]
MEFTCISCVWFWILLLILLQTVSGSNYLIGVGSYDITGPAADVNMMGYANAEQIVSGVHFRLRARSFIVAEPPKGNRLVFVNLDACMGSQLVTLKVIERLKARYGNLYTENNVAVSGIHTHAGPGGYLQYVVYIVTSLGFVRQSFDALVDGIEKCIIQAHESIQPGSVFVNKGELLDAGVNRSPSAYLNNPASERSKYKYNVDKEMTLLKFVDDEWGPVGSFNWFATHGTSMSRTNQLISGDNKGVAARLMEDWFEKNNSLKDVEGLYSDSDSDTGTIPRRVSNIIPNMLKKYLIADDELKDIAASFQSSGGRRATRLLSVVRRVRSASRQADKPRFVSAFCQTNCGDVSPNVLGAFCTDTGLPCDFNQSTCNGKNELCYGRGPGYPDEFESTRIIGDRQFKVAGGGSEVIKTCPASMGFSMAAGTTDGPGAFDFKQGDDKSISSLELFQGNAFWRLVRNLLKNPDKEQVDCQHPKPILLDTGEMKQPYDWAPSILPIQILRIGQLVILSVPGGFGGLSYVIGSQALYQYLFIHTSQGSYSVVFYCYVHVSYSFLRVCRNCYHIFGFDTIQHQYPSSLQWLGGALSDAVKTVLVTRGHGEFDGNIHVVIAGLTNTYSQYITTFEEYEVQRYEGASTLYGPHTLSAYIQEFKKLAESLLNGSHAEPGPQPPDLLNKQIGLVPPVVADSTPLGVKFGDVSTDVPANSTFKRGEMATVTFWSGCPRNDLMTEGTFALVEFLKDKETWIPVYDDDDLCLRFKWSRPWKLSTRSHATIEWRIPEAVVSGVYRIRHFGAAKVFWGQSNTSQVHPVPL